MDEKKISQNIYIKKCKLTCRFVAHPCRLEFRGTMARSVARRLIVGRNQCAQHSRFPSSLFCVCVCVPLARNFYVRVSILFFRGTIFQRLIFLLAAPFWVRFLCVSQCVCALRSGWAGRVPQGNVRHAFPSQPELPGWIFTWCSEINLNYLNNNYTNQKVFRLLRARWRATGRCRDADGGWKWWKSLPHVCWRGSPPLASRGHTHTHAPARMGGNE